MKKTGMQYVSPIKDLEHINEIARVLKCHKERDYVLFTLGINSGLRISDLLSIKTSDIANMTRLVQQEDKTGKWRDVPFCPNLIKIINHYLENRKVESQWLFPSQKGGGKNHISRFQAYRILNNICDKVGVQENIGTHTLRKTFAFQLYQKGVDISAIQTLLNHESQKDTLRYIGIEKQMLDDVVMNLQLGI